MARCLECGGKGKKGGCPTCGKHLDISTMPVQEAEAKRNKYIKKCMYASIPNEYIGMNWDANFLIANHPDRANDLTFTEGVKSMEIFHKKFIQGEVPKQSAIFMAPNKYGKSILAYSCMQHALKHNYTVAPMIDTLDLKRLMRLSSENPNYKLFNYIEYDNYITSQVVFISVTETDQFSSSMTEIWAILAKRSRLGLPTFIISKFDYRDMCQDCVDKDYHSLEDFDALDNDLRYPVLVNLLTRRNKLW